MLAPAPVVGSGPLSSDGGVIVPEKRKSGKAAGERATSTQRFEINQLGKKYGLSTKLVRKVMQKEGPARRDVEKYLQKVTKK